MDDTATSQSTSYVHTYVPPSDSAGATTPGTGNMPVAPQGASAAPAPGTSTPSFQPHSVEPNSWLASSGGVSPSPTNSEPAPEPVTPAANPENQQSEDKTADFQAAAKDDSWVPAPFKPVTAAPPAKQAAADESPKPAPEPKPLVIDTPDIAKPAESKPEPVMPAQSTAPAPAGEAQPAVTAQPAPPATPAPVEPPKPSQAEAQPSVPADKAEERDESLETQNIFNLLGVNTVSETEKESFLDELQQVIWEDFLENDVQLLLTESEMTQFQKLQGESYPDDMAKQEALVVFLEKLIPDLEAIMLEKALELKHDMVVERINGMKEFFAGQSDKQETLSKVETMISQDKWRTASDTLNAMAAS